MIHFKVLQAIWAYEKNWWLLILMIKETDVAIPAKSIVITRLVIMMMKEAPAVVQKHFRDVCARWMRPHSAMCRGIVTAIINITQQNITTEIPNAKRTMSVTCASLMVPTVL